MTTPSHPHHCLRQYSDQMTCRQCGKTWDVNDPEPPACKIVKTPQQHIAALREILKK
jgi:hypothetical protein